MGRERVARPSDNRAGDRSESGGRRLEESISTMDGEFDEAALRRRLEELESEHRELDEEVKALTMCGVVDQLKVMRLKRRKLALKDEIFRVADILNPDIIA
jgi:hypothetical protein